MRSVFQHILQRRQVATQVDADLAAHRIGEALAVIHMMKVPQSRRDIWELIGYVASANRHLLVALKCVQSSQAKSGQDEWWVQTAYPIGRQKIRQLEARGLVSRILQVSGLTTHAADGLAESASRRASPSTRGW